MITKKDLLALLAEYPDQYPITIAYKDSKGKEVTLMREVMVEAQDFIFPTQEDSTPVLTLVIKEKPRN